MWKGENAKMWTYIKFSENQMCDHIRKCGNFGIKKFENAVMIKCENGKMLKL